MRFSVRDLLVLMVFVAVIATAEQIAWRGVALELMPKLTWIHLSSCGSMVVGTFIGLRLRHWTQGKGKKVASVYNESFTRIFAMFVLSAALILSVEHLVRTHLFWTGIGGLLSTFLGVGGLMLWISGRNVQVRTTGLLHQGGFVGWNDPRLVFDEATHILKWPNKKRTAVELHLTPELSVQVKHLIAAHRGA